MFVSPLTTTYAYMVYMSVKRITPPTPPLAEKPSKTLFNVFAWIGGILIPGMIFGAIVVMTVVATKMKSKDSVQQVVPVK